MNNLKDRVTIYQVAQASGVSLATVSRVINKRGSVTPATRKRVEETIQRLGYKPSGLAQALATNRTTNIGVIIPSANYVYIANVLNGITDVAKEKGFVLTLFTTSHSRDEAKTMMEKLITAHVDGAIIFDDQLAGEEVTEIASYNVPADFLPHYPSVDHHGRVVGEKIGNIVFNYDTQLETLIRDYYLNGGEKPMTFLHVHNAGRLLGRCEKTFIRAHEDLHKEYNIINTNDSYARTYADFLSYFQEHRNGYFVCYRDSIAAAVMNAAGDSGLRVPQDVEVVSLVGTKYANICRPQLSTMHIDMIEVGKRAMYMLDELMNGDLYDKTAHFNATYLPSASTMKK